MNTEARVAVWALAIMIGAGLLRVGGTYGITAEVLEGVAYTAGLVSSTAGMVWWANR